MPAEVALRPDFFRTARGDLLFFATDAFVAVGAVFPLDVPDPRCRFGAGGT
jgi:hypothetical protein